MKRPEIIIHILSALDGKITGPFMGAASVRAASGEYARIRSEYRADAWLYGTVTTKEFTGGRRPELEETGDPVPGGDFAAVPDAGLYYVSVDTLGEIGWESGTFRMPGRPDAHVIEILTERTPAAYRRYLRRRGVSYILAGKDALDCREACEKLYALFGIRTMLVCGGGTVNWTFLQQGMADEISIVLAPAADGNRESVTVFEQMPGLPSDPFAEFELKDVERLKDSGLHLVYAPAGGERSGSMSQEEPSTADPGNGNPGEETAQAAAHPEEIRGMVLLYPAFVLADRANELFGDVSEIPDTYHFMWMDVGRAYFEPLIGYDIYQAIGTYDRDVLLIHGDADSIVPLSYSERALEVYPSAELKVVEGGGHGFYGEDAGQVTGWMLDYLEAQSEVADWVAGLDLAG